MLPRRRNRIRRLCLPILLVAASGTWVRAHAAGEPAWFETFVAAEVAAGSALDVAFLLDTPAGRHGALTASQGRLCFSDGLQMFHPQVIAAHRRFVEFLFTHANPYAGRTWSEEPGLAMVELYNEDDPFYL
jgi:hypothetical protein